jgi:type IV/VI secretion system ImpK/VasF family protein
MDSLLRAATPALELAGVLLDDDRDHGQLTPSEIREAAEAALSELSLSPKVQTSRELSAASASDALLAVAALLDELALRDEGALAERWRRVALLQQRFLHPDLTTAGDRFFDRLEELLVAPRSAATLSVLRIYAICLELGFQGRYAAQDEGQPLIEARRRLALRLGTLAEPLAEARSHLASGKAPPRSRRRVLPALVALCLATAALSLGLAHHRLGRAIDDAQLHIDGHRQELIEVAR